MLEPEEYEAWRQHPITRLVFSRLRAKAEMRRQVWIANSWDAGSCDKERLCMLRGQAEAFKFLPDASFEEMFGEKE